VRRFLSWSGLVTVAFVLAALGSAATSARIVVPHLGSLREQYAPFEETSREEAITTKLGFQVPTWRRLERSVRKGDRYHFVADVPYQHEIRNYAAYALLPAIQVADAEDANVVVYWQEDPPAGAACADVGQRVCVLRRPS
jgi:hypothetical protein